MDLRLKDLAILRHVALYRLTLPDVVDRLFCRGKGGDATTILVNLAKAGLLLHHKKKEALGGEQPYFTLTREGARIVGGPEDRSEPLGESALRTHLAVIWFCCMGDRRRYRLEPDELKALLGQRSLHENIPCCISEEEDGPRVYRVYPTSTDPRSTVRQLRTNIGEAWQNAAMRPWIEARDLGFAVLAEKPSKCADLERLVKKAGRDDQGLQQECCILVRFAPSPKGVKMALAELRGSSS